MIYGIIIRKTKARDSLLNQIEFSNDIVHIKIEITLVVN